MAEKSHNSLRPIPKTHGVSCSDGAIIKKMLCVCVCVCVCVSMYVCVLILLPWLYTYSAAAADVAHTQEISYTVVKCDVTQATVRLLNLICSNS